MRRLILCFIGLFALCVPDNVRAQTLSPYAVKVNAFQDHSVDFYAFDSQNQPIRNLQTTDFLITHNGSTPLPVTSVTCPPVTPAQKLSVVLCLDISGSMRQENPTRMSTVRNAASLFVNMLDTTQNECAITSFDHLSYINQDFTNRRTDLLAAINSLQPQGATDYNNALLSAPTGALNVATRGQNKRVVILLTDGDGGGKLDSIVNFARTYNIIIYTIAYHLQAPSILYDMATQTGGQMFGDLNYESIGTATQLNAAFRACLYNAQGIAPCTVHYWADRYCYSQWRYVTVGIPTYNIPSIGEYYIMPTTKIPYVYQAPYSLTFGAVAPGTYADKVVQLYSYYAPITVDGATFTNSRFSIVSWGGSPPPFIIDSATSRFITVRYTSTDTSYQYGALNLQSNMCYWGYVGASAGYQSRTVPQKTISLINPVSPENYNSCYYSYFRWDGVAAHDSVRVEWSYDDGKTWTMLQDNFSGNFEQWFRSPTRTGPNNRIKVSHVKFQNDRLQALKNGHAGNMKQFALNPQNQNQAVVSLNPDANYLSARRAYVVNLQNGDTLATLTPGGNKVIQSVMWSSDGSTIVTALNGSSGAQLILWSASTYQVIRTITELSGTFTCAALNSAGTRIAAGIASPSNPVRIYNVSTGAVLATLSYHANFPTAVSFSNDGTRLASTDLNGRVVVWNMSTYARINSMDVTPTAIANSVNFNPVVNDVLVVAYQSGVTRIWSTLSGAEIRNYTGNIGAHYYAQFNTTGARVVSCGETAVGSALYRGASAVWDASSGSNIFNIDGTGKINQHNWRSYWAQFTSDGARLVTVNSFGGLNIWTTAGVHERQLLVRQAMRGAVVSGCFFNNDRNVATMGEDGSVGIHDVASRDTVRYFYDLASNASRVNQVRVSPSGVFMAALSTDNTFALWNIQTGQLISRISNAGYGPAFSGNSQYVALVVDSIVNVYATATGSLFKTVTLSNFIAGRDLVYNYNDSRILVAGVSSASTMSIVSVNTTSWAESSRFTDTYYIGGECQKLSYSPGSKFSMVYHQPTGRSFVVDSTMTRINTINNVVHAITPNSGYQVGYALATTQASVWRTSDGALLRSVNPHQSFQVSQVAVSDNSSRALICSHDGNAWLWDFVATPIQSDSSATPFYIGTSVLQKKDTINFGKVLNNGSKDSVINQIIINTGTSWDYIYSVYLEGYNKDEFRIVKKNTSLYLYPGQSLTYELGFIPRTKVVGIKEVKLIVVTLCDTLRFTLVGESVYPPTNNLVDQIDFGKVEITTRKDTVVTSTIRNVTTSPLNITSTRILSPDTVQFSIVSGGGAFTLQPNETRQITLRFAPTRIARTSARLAFFHAFLGSPATILLSGEGIGIPRIAATNRDFTIISPICSELTPVDTLIRINNIGTGVMSIDSTKLIGSDSVFFRFMTPLPDTIAAGSSKQYRVRYLPQFAGTRASTLRVFSNAQNVNNGSIDFNLIGKRDTVILNFIVQNLDLVGVRPFTSVDAFLSLTNKGSVPMYLPVPVQLGKFSILSISPNPIPSGVTARVYVNFNNGDTSQVYDTLYTVRDTCGGLSSVRLRAFTQSPKPTIFVLSLLDMQTSACATYADTTIIVTNVGMLPLKITDLNIIGDTLKQYSILYKPRPSIEPNEIDSIVIRCTPTTTATQSASLRITSNAQNSIGGESLIPLSMKWIYTSYTLDTNFVAWSNLAPNAVGTATIGLTNTGTSAIAWTVPMTKGRFTITSISPNPTPVNSRATVSLRFSGAPSGSIIRDTLAVLDPCLRNQPLALYAQVQTTKPQITLASMPEYTLACRTTLDTFFVLRNVGLDTLRIDSLTFEQSAELKITTTYKAPRRILSKQSDTVFIRLDGAGSGSLSVVVKPILRIRSNSESDSILTQTCTVSIKKADLKFAVAELVFPKLRPYRQNTQQVVLRNTGTLPLRLTLPIIRKKFSIDSLAKNPVAAGDSVIAYVRFAGDSVGIYSDTLSVLDSCGNIHKFALKAEVAAVVPAHLQSVATLFTTERCYSAIDTTILITNTGGEDLSISRIYVRGVNANEFSVINDTSLILAPEETHLVLVRHQSHGVTGVRSAELVTLSNTDSLVNAERVVQLLVQKDSVDIQWEFSQIHFGIVDKNNSFSASIGLVNAGTRDQLFTLPLRTKYFRVDSVVPNPILAGTKSNVFITFDAPDSVGLIKEVLAFSNECTRQVPLEVAAQLRGQVDVYTKDTQVQIGDVFTLPVHISDAEAAQLSGIDKVKMTLRWNNTVLQLKSVKNATLLSNVEDDTYRIATIESSPINAKDSTIAILELQAALGNDTMTTVEFTSVSSQRGVADLKARGSVVNVTGHCRDGGVRLIDRKALTMLRAVYPNPGDGNVTLELSTPERAPILITLFDASAKEVRVLYTGMPPADEWQFKAFLTDIPSGVYQVILQTRSEVKTKRLEIVR